jgi:hypothetical protein
VGLHALTKFIDRVGEGENQCNLELPVRPILLLRWMEGILYSEMRKGRGWLSATARSTVALSRMRQGLYGVERLVVEYEVLAAAPEATLRRVSRVIFGSKSSREHGQRAGP